MGILIVNRKKKNNIYNHYSALRFMAIYKIYNLKNGLN